MRFWKKSEPDRIFDWRGFGPDPEGRMLYEPGYIYKPGEDHRFWRGNFPEKTPWQVFTGWGSTKDPTLKKGQTNWFKTYADAVKFASRYPVETCETKCHSYMENDRTCMRCKETR